MIDVGALDVELQAIERRLFLLEFVRELRRIDDGEHVVLLDLVAGMDIEIDEARASRIERRATAATILPCTETSRVSVPRLTSAKRSRAVLADESETADAQRSARSR